MTDLCVNVLKTGRLSEYIEALQAWSCSCLWYRAILSWTLLFSRCAETCIHLQSSPALIWSVEVNKPSLRASLFTRSLSSAHLERRGYNRPYAPAYSPAASPALIWSVEVNNPPPRASFIHPQPLQRSSGA